MIQTQFGGSLVRCIANCVVELCDDSENFASFQEKSKLIKMTFLEMLRFFRSFSSYSIFLLGCPNYTPSRLEIS